tara:strand:- start:1061 stop:1516 length:456 start_codon:yes stop_codon:yes gene_type:complete
MRFVLIILLFFISNCKLNKVVKHHGIHYLDKKQKTLKINTTNQNDIINLLGPPSTRSKFDNDMWIYIERKSTKGSMIKLGKKKTIVNNVLVLEIDDTGLLVKKNFLNINDMKKIEFSKNETEVNYSKNSFVYDFLTSLRHKINDPAGKRRK